MHTSPPPGCRSPILSIRPASRIPGSAFTAYSMRRLDRDLLREMAHAHPELHFVLIGPVVKITEDMLPRGENLHYLGKKEYEDLPSYIAHWDVAMLPFAQNASTRFISPTKTPEYLAAGKPVVSTPIRDVVTPYADKGFSPCWRRCDRVRCLHSDRPLPRRSNVACQGRSLPKGQLVGQDLSAYVGRD